MHKGKRRRALDAAEDHERVAHPTAGTHKTAAEKHWTVEKTMSVVSAAANVARFLDDVFKSH